MRETTAVIFSEALVMGRSGVGDENGRSWPEVLLDECTTRQVTQGVWLVENNDCQIEAVQRSLA